MWTQCACYTAACPAAMAGSSLHVGICYRAMTRALPALHVCPRAFSPLHVGLCQRALSAPRASGRARAELLTLSSVPTEEFPATQRLRAQLVCAADDRVHGVTKISRQHLSLSLSPVHGVAMSSYFILGPRGHPLHLLAVTLLAHPSGEHFFMLLDRVVRAIGSVREVRPLCQPC